MPRHDHVPHGLRPDGVGRDLPVAKPHDERLPARPQKLAQRAPERPRSAGKAPRLVPVQCFQLSRDIRAARLAERLLALSIQNPHHSYMNAVPVLLARDDARELRLLVRGAEIQLPRLHSQICSWLHDPHLAASFGSGGGEYTKKIFQNREKKIDFMKPCRYNVFLHETVFVS